MSKSYEFVSVLTRLKLWLRNFSLGVEPLLKKPKSKLPACCCRALPFSPYLVSLSAPTRLSSVSSCRLAEALPTSRIPLFHPSFW